MPNSVVLWLTGLPASGKTTLSRIVAHGLRLPVQILDGDEIRKTISPDLGFTPADRRKQVTRVAHVAQLLSQNGVNTVVALVSPERQVRQKAREIIGSDRFIEVFVDAPVDVCIDRDPKGMYAKALRGEITDFTGIDDPYDEPTKPEVRVETAKHTEDQCARKILAEVVERARTAVKGD